MQPFRFRWPIGSGSDVPLPPFSCLLRQSTNVWIDFPDGQCRPHAAPVRAMDSCLRECPATCLACGLDPATGACVCKEKGRPHGPDRVIKAHPELAPASTGNGSNAAGAGVRFKQDLETVLVFPSLVPEEQMTELDAYLQHLLESRERHREIIEHAGSPMHRIVGPLIPFHAGTITRWITYSEQEEELGPHLDQHHGEGITHTALLYLDDVAGTRFWEIRQYFDRGFCPLITEGARGSLVVFPITLFHDSDRYKSEGASKRMLSLALKLPGRQLVEKGIWGLLTEELAARQQQRASGSASVQADEL